MMDLKELQAQVDSWIIKHGVRYFEVMTNAALLSEEVGELSGLLARIYGEQSFKGNEPEKPLRLVADELADVLFVVVCLANQLEIDLGDSIVRNLQKKTARDHDRHHQNPKLGES